MKIKVLFLLSFLSTILFAQPGEKLVKIAVAPDKADWNYNLKENAEFSVSVTKNSVPLDNIDEARYELSYDMMTPFRTGNLELKNGKATIKAGAMNVPGFLRCRIFIKHDGRNYEGMATAGFATRGIAPTTEMPADFVTFWDEAKAANATIPIDPILTLLPEKCNSKVNVYELSIQNYQSGSRIYGILCVPKKPGKYPALLRVPGAGIRPYGGNLNDAENGNISLEIGIHGIPVTMDKKIYDNLSRGALDRYHNMNWDDRNLVYYKRVYMGCVRAIDYIFSMGEFDGKNMYVIGASQGGALSIVTAALDNRVTGLVSIHPALCEVSGYLKGGVGGWPHLRKKIEEPDCVTQQKIKTMAYYDVVNFARLVKVPGFYSFGYNDMVCPPTTMFSAYNVITAPKELLLVPETAHYIYPEQWSKGMEFISNNMK